MENQIYKVLSYRSLAIGLSGTIIGCLIAPYNDYIIRGVFSSGGHFPVFPFFILIILVLIVNIILKSINPELSLSPQELITIWSVMCVASGIPCSGMMRYCLSTFVSYKYFATPENEWETLFHHYIPHWRVVRDGNAIKSFYEGISFGESIPWKAWIIPLSVWTVYVLTIYFLMVCLSVLLRKQWMDVEKCTFPLVQLPMEVSEQPAKQVIFNSFFRNRIMWIGLSIPVFIHTINGLNAFFPSVPYITLEVWLDPFLVSRPWNALRPFKVFVVLSMIGFSYLLTLEVSLSLWLFFLFFKFQCLIGSLLGFHITSGPGVQWTGHSFSAAQEAGACMTFAIAVFWKARNHITNMLKGVFYHNSEEDEVMPHSLTILGLISSIFFLVFLNHLMGMSYAFALMFVLFLVGMYIVLTWQIINGGIPFINPSFSPQSFFLTTLGSSRISRSSMTSLFMHPVSLTLDLREFMMPYVMNALKAADEVRINRKHLLIAMFASMTVGLIVSYYSVLKLCYHNGALYLMSGWSGYLNQLNSILISPPAGKDWINTGFILFGSAFMMFLIWIRSIFVWWPLHPIGYTMFSSWATFQLWFSILIGYIIKYGILRYGGLVVYRRAKPIFLGLILGEMLCAGIWMVIGIISGETMSYRILWF